MKTWIFIGLLLSILCGGAYYYYTTTQSTIQTYIESNTNLRNEKDRLIDVNQSNQNTITDLNDSFDQITQNYNQLQSEFQVIRSQNNELRERLGRHELGALAEAKPQLVENIVNNASEKALRCFELLSGAPLTEAERNATNERQFNSECPFLWNNLP